eukprot:CAMPEP_0119514214 /NCGR_PEP_ID=MMETSP1344-20130328/32100_1 /TAXON_ID=236787 /ORGANISM="Florenciella parvula, Strain CCMP2471" /LENGTH=37 /DNA_ID= /DNA_START= /DNA_END= /DNA_ORIENTATION=
MAHACPNPWRRRRRRNSDGGSSDDDGDVGGTPVMTQF